MATYKTKNIGTGNRMRGVQGKCSLGFWEIF